MTITAEPAELGFSASAAIDPEFFLPPGTPGQIIYSSGVTQATVPEPGSLALLATACGGLLWRRRRRRRPA